MAIILPITLKTGIVSTYHRIPENGIMSRADGSGSITIERYLSKEARDNKKSPLERKGGLGGMLPEGTPAPAGTFTEEELKKEGNSPRSIAYTFLKTLSAWEGAQDDL